MLTKKWSIILLLSLFLVTSLTAQNNTKHIRESQLLSNEKSMHIDVEYALGKFTLNPSLSEEAYVVNIDYPADIFTPSVDYSIEDGVGYLTVKSNTGEDDDINIDWEERDANSRWDIEYNPIIPTTMDLGIGLGKGVLELGDAHITRLDVENGLSETEINFSKPNNAILEVMDFETGLGKFRAKSLGNARFKEMNFECGLGSATLDFHGAILDKCVAEISVGLGSATLIVPEDLGVQVETKDSFMSSVSFDSSFRRHDGNYYSPNWNEAERKMKLKVEVGLGSISVERIP